MSSNGKHKSLASSFGTPPPERGSKLQGLLQATARTSAAAGTDTVAPPTEPDPAAGDGHDAPAAEPSQVAARAAVARQAPAPEVAAVAQRSPAKVRRARTGEGRGSASSVYLTADTYKQLTATKSRKIKDYAQIVQDAFAQVVQEAADRGAKPDEVLAGLFEVPEDHDEWLMPSSTSRSKSATPLTEARISFSAQQRAWIEQKMTVVGRPVTFSEFVARVLDHHLVPAKRR